MKEWNVYGWGTIGIYTTVQAETKEEALAKVKNNRNSFEWTQREENPDIENVEVDNEVESA